MSSIKYSNGLYKTTSRSQDKRLNELWMLFNPINSSTNFDQTTGIVLYILAIQDDQKELYYKIFEVNRQGKILSVSTRKDY